MLPVEVFAHDVADHRRTAETATRQDGGLDAAIVGAVETNADIVDLDGSTVGAGTSDGNLELARQIGEFRVKRGPLTDQLTPGTWIDCLVVRDTGELVSRGIADAVAAGLDRMHFDLSQFGENRRDIFQLRPVQLQILAGGEVSIGTIITTADGRHGAQLDSAQHAVGNGDTQHRGMTLDVEAVLQAQRAEFFISQTARQIAIHLVLELSYPLVDQCLVVGVIAIHVRGVLRSGIR